MAPHVHFANRLLWSSVHRFYVGLLLPSPIVINERDASAASFPRARILLWVPGSDRSLAGMADRVRQ